MTEQKGELIISYTEEQVAEYEKQRNALMVPDPWDDKFCKKIGLINMYIESTIAQLIPISAEMYPGVQINVPNPKYKEFHDHLAKVLSDDGNEGDFDTLVEFIEDMIERQLELVSWEGYVPDIRLLRKIDDGVSWLRQHRVA